MKQLIFDFLYIVLGSLIGIILRHYFYENIPFDRIFGLVEKVVYVCADFLQKITRCRCFRFIVSTLKRCLLTCFNALKWFGKLIYKNRTAIRTATVKCANAVMETATGEDIAKFHLDYTRGLMDGDIESFIKSIEGHPYDVVTLDNCYIQEGVYWYNFSAWELSKSYEDLDLDSRIKMLEKKLQKYMGSTRKVTVDIYITMAAPTGFCFGMALSRYGEETLEKLRQKNAVATKEESSPQLEEVIDLFADSDGDNV